MPSDIEEIKHRLDLGDLISEYVKLKAVGSNLKGLCPFHNEKTPSFIVSPDKQIWHCFGCAKGGDIFSFIQNIEGVEFPEALRILAHRAGVKLEYHNPEEHNHKTRLLDLLAAAAGHWHYLLLNNPAALPVRDYLAERGVKPGTIEEFLLGYSADSWDEIIKFLQDKNFTLKEIFDAGLSVTGEKNRPYDRFRHRLMFPIRDLHGNVVGFTSRKLRETDQGGKYVNSPQNLIYNKSQILYNLDLAKAEIKRLGYAILVEGNMDALACYQVGTKNAVACSGTALTADQVRLLKRYTQNIMIAFDADQAGVSANFRGIDLAWQAGFNVKVITIPAGKDPDELIRQDPKAWREQIKSAYNFMDYLFSLSLRGLSLERVDHKKQAAKKILPLLAKLGDPVEKAHYLRKLADLLGVPEESLKETLASFKIASQPQKPAVQAVKPGLDQHKVLAEHFLSLMLKFPEQFGSVIQHLEPEMIQYPAAKELYKELIIYYNKNHHLTEKSLEQELSQELVDYFNQLTLLMPEDLAEAEPQLITYEIKQAVNRLKEIFLKSRLKNISQQLAVAEKAGDQAELNLLSEEFSKIAGQLQSLET